jgi:hypothetical protein
MRKLSIQEGDFLVKLAREAIEYYLKQHKYLTSPQDYPPILNEERGIFVTLESYPSNNLRGCIGYPLGEGPLISSTIDAAVSSAFSDPRFEPLTPRELNLITIEITVLSQPEIMSLNQNYIVQFEIGEHGLLVRSGSRSGILLPQVPVEQKWDKETFLRHICLKAGLAPDCYKNKYCQFFKFFGQIFKESNPEGEVKERDIKKEVRI